MLYIEQIQKLTQRQKAKKKNVDEYNNTFADLLLATVEAFQWHDLPETCNERMLETALTFNGMAMIAEIEGALFTLIATPDGSLNLYGDPTGGYGYGLNGYNQHFNFYIEGADKYQDGTKPINEIGTRPNAVFCKDNKYMYPFVNYLTSEAQRIADAQRSLDVIAHMLKSPTILNTDEKSVQNVKQVLNDLDNNTLYILGIGGLPYENLKAIDTGAKAENLEKLYDYREHLIGKIYEKIGVTSNPAFNKKERSLVDEIGANNLATTLTLEARLKERQIFCEKVNKFFGTNISVSSRYLDYIEDKEDNEDEEKEEEKNERDEN